LSVVDIHFIREEHDHSIHADRDPAARRHSFFEGFEKLFVER
jgi:hypothetical protein